MAGRAGPNLILEVAIAEDLRSLIIFPVADGPGRSKRAELRIWIFRRMW
jgi:hypothetical protein